MGRTLAFVARQIRDGRTTSALGVGINEVSPFRPRKSEGFGCGKVFGTGLL